MKADTPSVSVVIPTRNRIGYLRQAVDSIQDQTLRSRELIVVDDHSTDGTGDWLRSLEVPSIRVVTLEERSERSVARNHGLRVAQGASILFLDDDDLLRADALQRLFDELSREPDAVAAVGGFVRFDEMGPFKVGAHVRRRVKRDVWPDVVIGWGGTPGRALFRTQALREIGGFDEDIVYWEDWDLWLRVARLGPVVLVPETVLEYRVHGTQSEDRDGPEVRATYIDELLDELPQRYAARGRSAIKAWHFHRVGMDAMGNDDPRKALSSFARALRVDRSLYASPLQRRRMREPLLRALATAPLGRRGTRVARRILGRVRRAAG